MTVIKIQDVTDECNAEAQPGSSVDEQANEDSAVQSDAITAAVGDPGMVPGGDQLECPQDGDAASDQRSLEQSEALKQEGNAFYAAGSLEEALDKYTEALAVAPESAVAERAVYLGNRAACQLKLRQFAEAAQDCSQALELSPAYTKVLLRRSSAYEELDDLERALADAQKVVELEPENRVATMAVQRLEPKVNERREKLKEEMLGKLKDLGNTVLGKFGLSLDNFKAEKDPQTGSYSIKFSQ